MIKTLILAIAILSASCHLNSGLRKPFFHDMKLKVQDAHVDEIIQCMDGFFSTVGIYADIPAFAACKDYDFNAIKDAIAVMTDAVTGDYWGLIKSVAYFTKDAWNIFRNCDFKTFDTQVAAAWKIMIANFTQPDYIKKVSVQAEKNLFQIMADAKTMYDQLKNNQFNDFGKSLGSLMRLVFILQEAK